MRTFDTAKYTPDEIKCMDTWYATMSAEILDSVFSIDIRDFANKLLDDIPDYFFLVPASSSGKYHPETDLGPGGLVRHSINVKRMLKHIMTVDKGYDTRTRDLLMVAALFHDCMKSGSQEDYEKNPHTKFLHPVLASAFILVEAAKHDFSYESANMIADFVASHMGQWNTSTKENGTLPYPDSYEQKALHLADYLASRKGIEMTVEPVYPESVVEIDTTN